MGGPGSGQGFGAQRARLSSALRAQYEKLRALEANLFHAGCPEQSSMVAWAALMVGKAQEEIDRLRGAGGSK